MVVAGDDWLSLDVGSGLLSDLGPYVVVWEVFDERTGVDGFRLGCWMITGGAVVIGVTETGFVVVGPVRVT